MLEFHDVEQNTDEWRRFKAGKLTNSNLGKVMANYGKAFGEPAKKLAVQIAIEQITGEPQDSGYSNDHMERGHEQEPLARMAYEEEMFCDVLNGGFFSSEFIGCSPDGRVADKGLIEIKSVIPSVHFANITRAGVDPAYKWQCFGNVKYTGYEWLDFISYCADFPKDKQLYIYRIYAADLDEEFSQIRARTEQFKELIETTKDKILNSDYLILNAA